VVVSLINLFALPRAMPPSYPADAGYLYIGRPAVRGASILLRC
jgi:hypothetical protein